MTRRPEPGPAMCNASASDQLSAMLRQAAAKVRANQQLLTELDSVTGDGDHGTAMVRAMDAIEGALEAAPDASPAARLANAGWAVMAAAGGSTGPLLGSFLAGMGEPLAKLPQDSPLDGPAVAAMIRGGVAAMQQHTRAQVGDKTMMDALLPAVEVLGRQADSQPLRQLLRLAADAAATGAENTRDMQAKFGRARNLGTRTLGHADPGATSMALLLAGFAEAFDDRPPLPDAPSTNQ